MWHSLDNFSLFADKVFYAKGAVRIVRNFIHLSWLDFFRSLNDVTEMLRPPGASLLLAPFAALFHYDMKWMNASSILWYFVIFGAIYQMGKKYINRETGLLAIVYFMFLSQAYHLKVDPEFYQLFLLPMLFLCFDRMWDNGWRGYLCWFFLGLITAFGFTDEVDFCCIFNRAVFLFILDMDTQRQRTIFLEVDFIVGRERDTGTDASFFSRRVMVLDQLETIIFSFCNQCEKFGVYPIQIRVDLVRIILLSITICMV